MPHSAGPWCISQDPSGRRYVVSEVTATMICTLTDYGDSVSEGDAHLIVSGPDLEAAVRLALPILAAYRAIARNGRYAAQVKAADALEAALAKVDGKGES